MTSDDIVPPSGLISPTTTNSQMENIKVAVRLRPFTEKEKQRKPRRIVDIEQNTVALYNPNNVDTEPKKFTFDYSYWSHDGFRKDNHGVNISDSAHPNSEKYVSQEKVFQDLGNFLLTNALEGYNSALLAYGQTGSGKSYTVSGYGQNEGILPRFARALYEELDKKARVLSKSSSDENSDRQARKDLEKEEVKENSKSNNRYEVLFSMLEIYNEVVRDLLAKTQGDLVTQSTIARGLKVREHPKHGFFVENLTSYACADKDEIERKIEEGHLSKSIAATSMNETSSRGHTIYEFKIKQYKLKSPESPSETLTTSVVQLVDLAGSERMAVHVTSQTGGESFIASRSNSPYVASGRIGNEKLPPLKTNRTKMPTSASSTSSTPQVPSSSSSKRNAQANLSFQTNHQQRFKESVSINQSLSALGNCIQVMSQYSQQLDLNGQSKRPWPKIPYRDSVLTKLLNRCCLSGNSKVVIIATLSPLDSNYDDTLSTLRFADRAKQIRTHAIVNQMSRNDVVDNLQKENHRLKQLVDGRVTRSDDSSQTSNFDDTENAMDNFTGSKIISRASNLDTMATPSRGRTTTRRPRDKAASKSQRRATDSSTKLVNSSSNPSLVVKEQMERLVSPASRKLMNDANQIHKSRSMNYGLANSNKQHNNRISQSRNSDHNELVDTEVLDDVDLNDLSDIKEGLISPDSDESISALADEDLTNEEKIGMFNRLLSNSSVATKDRRSPTKRPRKANSSIRAGIRQVSILSSSLKKSNPYLSNLNPDEQLTGKISYIVKEGETIVGKDIDCDIVLHGPELRCQHAKLTRASQSGPKERGKIDGDISYSTVSIEPIFEDSVENSENTQLDLEKSSALMVNGLTITKKVRLNHCDRILFGTNSYFVFADNTSIGGIGDTIANLDLVTYDMARAEVLKKVMAEAKNEAMLKEINDYTHRPGTGKHKMKPEEQRDKKAKETNSRGSKNEGFRLTRSMTINDQEEINDRVADTSNESELHRLEKENLKERPFVSDESGASDSLDLNYRDQLMQDTYEYAMPVAEVNAVAKEMGIKVVYGLKILTGEEQLPDQTHHNHLDSDGFSSSSIGDTDASEEATRGLGERNNPMNEQVTNMMKVDFLDIPPALFIKVHLEEQGFDYYWSKEKFQVSRFKILELYGPWDVGGKSGLVEYLIDQSKTQGNYLFDPFVDDVSSTFVLIGHAQITLQPLSLLTSMKSSYSILDVNDDVAGIITVEAIPCHSEIRVPEVGGAHYQPFNEDELSKNVLKSSEKLLDKKLVFMLKIVSCQDILAKYSNIFCQYRLTRECQIVRTKILNDDTSDSKNSEDKLQKLSYDHSHFICIERVDEEMLAFLEHGFLTIQVVGNYKLPEGLNRSPTVVSTIINSINKYKTKMDQQNSFNGLHYSSSAYYNSNTNSIKSNRGVNSGAMNSNSGASSVVSTSATVNLFDQQNDDDDGMNSINGVSQENIIDMILTKRKLDRAENQLHYLKRTINIAEHYNKKHIPVKTVKKLLNSYGHELENGSLEEMTSDEIEFSEKNVTPDVYQMTNCSLHLTLD